MDVLSTTAGSAQAVRDAAAASESAIDSRLALERELDRLNAALGAHGASAAQNLNWALLAQAFLLTCYLIVLVGGWTVPLPGKRWLLAAIAGYGAISLVLGVLLQRASRDRLAPLRQNRKLVEEALERVANRPTVFSRERLLVRTLGDWAPRLLPVVILAGWSALSVYTLALPLPGDGRPVAAEPRTEPRAGAAAASTAPTSRARAPVRKVDENAPVTTAAPDAPPADGESGLAAFFRRGMNTPPPADSGDPVKP
jgi:hypothetical protein